MSKRRVLFVQNLDDNVNEDVVHAAFVPFGPLQSVQIPRDHKNNARRGFAFVEFESEDDCLAAMENMSGSELYGKTLVINLAKPKVIAQEKGKAIWSMEDVLKQQGDEGDTHTQEN
jgi:peptidyl-prolyl isomerase E (cyclophilin E)